MLRTFIAAAAMVFLFGFAATALAQPAQQGSGPVAPGSGGAISISLPNPLLCGQGSAPASGIGPSPKPAAQCVVDVIITALWVIIVPLVGLMIIIGGFFLVTSGGNPERVETGKKTITYAIVGFVVVVLASSVVAVIEDIIT